MVWRENLRAVACATGISAASLLLVGASTALADGPGCPGWRDPVGKKVVGGDPTSVKLWPSQAALRLTSPDGKRALFFCGGTAVTPDRVMTAAHCFDDVERRADGGYVSTDTDADTVGWTVDVVLGTDDLAAAGAAHAYPVGDVRLHDGYLKHQAPSRGNDIALVVLGRRWSGPLATLSLDAASDPHDGSGAALTVAGFGLLKGAPEGGALETQGRADGTSLSAGSRRLQQVGVPMVATDTCAAEWQKTPSGGLVGPGQLCAGYEAASDASKWKDSCGGDSGGPIVHYDGRGCPSHVGLVSWGARSCGRPRAYGVYTRLSHHAAWLRQHAPGVIASTVGAATGSGAGGDLTAAEFVAQAAAAIGGGHGRLRIAVEGGAVVRNKGLYRFNVTSDVGGRLVILDVNAEGAVTQLFPNEHVLRDDLGLVGAGQTIAVPGSGWGVVFRAGPPFGKGLLIALVMPPDVPIQPLVTAPARTKGFSAERSAVGYLMNLLQQITGHAGGRTLPAEGQRVPAVGSWALGTYEYEVRP